MRRNRPHQHRKCAWCPAVLPRQADRDGRILCDACYRAWLDSQPPHRLRPYMPTAAEIRAECARIQAAWTPAVEQQRAGAGARTAPGPMRLARLVCAARVAANLDWGAH